MAPRRKSQAEIEALGNAGRLSKAEIRARSLGPPSGLPLAGTPEAAAANPIGDAPSYLSDIAKAAWQLAAPALQAVSLLSAPDRIAFARYCGWLADYFAMEKAGRKTEAVQVTKSRNVKMQRLDKNFQARLMLDKRLMEYERAFGMTPESRQAIFARLATGYPLAFTAGKTADTSPAKKVIGFLNTNSKPPRLQ